ncbi:MAG: hypothetical protein KAH20_00305 [Methylococcales bacterium]|nr:hypothetical protein [Methylococcales bacterium]
MITQGKWEYSVTFLFIGCIVILIILMAVQYGIGTKYRTELIEKLSSSESMGFTMQEIPDYQFSKQQIGHFHDIVERPLFFKARQPITPVDDELTDTTASEKLDFILTGVINSPKGIYCLLQNLKAQENKDKFKRLEQGDEIDGWVIQEIHADHVIISGDGKTEEIKLAKPRLKSRVPSHFKKRLQAAHRKLSSHKPRIEPPKERHNPFKLKTQNRL